MKNIWLPTAFLLLLSASVAEAVLIGKFDSAESLAPWVFTNGPEYPGATGSLTLGPGHGGSGARLAFDISAGGNYVGRHRHPGQAHGGWRDPVVDQKTRAASASSCG